MAMTTLAIGAATASFANTGIADYLYFGSGSSPDVVFTGGAGGSLTTTSATGLSVGNLGDSDGATVLSINGVTEVAPVITNTNGVDAAFSGGSFSLTDGTKTLLTGTFTGSSLGWDTTSGSGSGSGANSPVYSIEGITYTGGTYLTDWTNEYGGLPPVTGSGSLSLSAATPALSNVGGYFSGFTSSVVTANWDAADTSAVPEPAQTVTMIVGGLLLVGMMVVARRRAGAQI